MCQRIGFQPISTIGFGRTAVSSERRVHSPHARITTCIKMWFKVDEFYRVWIIFQIYFLLKYLANQSLYFKNTISALFFKTLLSIPSFLLRNSLNIYSIRYRRNIAMTFSSSSKTHFPTIKSRTHFRVSKPSACFFSSLNCWSASSGLIPSQTSLPKCLFREGQKQVAIISHPSAKSPYSISGFPPRRGRSFFISFQRRQ